MKYTQLVKSLLHGDPVAMAANGFRNYHARGLDYLCLLRDPNLTIKLYFLDDPELRPDGCLVAPHDHRYSFEQICLAGEVEHIEFITTEFHPAWMISKWNAESRKFSPTGIEVGLNHTVRKLQTTDSYYLGPTRLHTLAHPSEAILLTFQYRDVREDSLTLFHERDEMPSLDGLYTPMDADFAANLVERARKVFP